jgi:DNA-binding response OmpR family regulator
MIPYWFRPPTNRKETGPLQGNRQQWKTTEKKKPRVLIVEDELLVAENLKEILQAGGYKVIEVVSSAEKAIENFMILDPDLIIMDVRLEGTLDGIHAAILIHETLKKVPILFLTAYRKDDFPYLLNLDPSLYSYICKPYNPKEFSAALKKLLPEE